MFEEIEKVWGKKSAHEVVLRAIVTRIHSWEREIWPEHVNNWVEFEQRRKKKKLSQEEIGRCMWWFATSACPLLDLHLMFIHVDQERDLFFSERLTTIKEIRAALEHKFVLASSRNVKDKSVGREFFAGDEVHEHLFPRWQIKEPFIEVMWENGRKDWCRKFMSRRLTDRLCHSEATGVERDLTEALCWEAFGGLLMYPSWQEAEAEAWKIATDFICHSRPVENGIGGPIADC